MCCVFDDCEAQAAAAAEVVVAVVDVAVFGAPGDVREDFSRSNSEVPTSRAGTDLAGVLLADKFSVDDAEMTLLLSAAKRLHTGTVCGAALASVCAG